MFEIDLTICIKMDLALNNLQWLIYHKTQPTNQHFCCHSKFIFSIGVSQLSCFFGRYLCTWTVNIGRMLRGPPCWLSMGHLTTRTTKLIVYWICSILWQYQTEGSIIIGAAVTNVTRYSSTKEVTGKNIYVLLFVCK